MAVDETQEYHEGEKAYSLSLKCNLILNFIYIQYKYIKIKKIYFK